MKYSLVFKVNKYRHLSQTPIMKVMLDLIIRIIKKVISGSTSYLEFEVLSEITYL